jgi:putative hydrolase of the HAD superfamily
LRRTGLERRFHAIVISGELGRAKPDGAAFARACFLLGIKKDGVWHVGDNLRADVGGARAAGLTAVWLNRDGLSLREGDPAPDYEVTTLAELPALLFA